MAAKDWIAENETVQWGVNTFIKVATTLFIFGAVAFFLEKMFDFTFDISAGLGL